MSDQEIMFRWWIKMLMPVLNGFTLATEVMIRAGEERKIVEVSMEAMQGMMQSSTLEEKQLLSRQLDLLCRLANES